MKILTFTSLFPNNIQPNNAIFIQHRMSAVNKIPDVEVKVVAPVPYFPNISVGSERWKKFAKIHKIEQRAGMQVFHPRYFVTPKVGMSLYGFFMFIGVLPTIRRLFKEWQFDVIDAHYVFPDGLAALLLSKFFNRPIIVSARGTDINLYPKFRLIKPLLQLVISKADGLISVCQSLADVMIDMGADKNKTRVIPNGIDPEQFFPIDKGIARQQLGFKDEKKILLTVGSLIERKGTHLLIRALKILKLRGELDFLTYIVGKGESGKELRKLVAELELSKDVFFAGEINNSELVKWYSAADLFFLGSSREGWPNVISESLACGTPVLATKVDGIPDIVHSNDLGIIVDRDVESFALALGKGFANNWNFKIIREQGQKRSWQTVAAEVYDVLNSVVFQ